MKEKKLYFFSFKIHSLGEVCSSALVLVVTTSKNPPRNITNSKSRYIFPFNLKEVQNKVFTSSEINIQKVDLFSWHCTIKKLDAMRFCLNKT